ncbi:MAG TPA: hypothetical protein VE825_07135 [Terriglobales bacterium]|jgi:hypothetical protein|nr:hypothetical protein [Terriglobales bacterium]
MATSTQTSKSYDEAVVWLRDHGFDILEAPGTKSRVFLKKFNVSAAIEKGGDDEAKLFARPGYLVAGEIAKLVDRGYGKFLRTSKAELPATADHLKSIHQFTEELKEGLGSTSLYNESLGTVNDDCLYDRLEDRDRPAPERPKRPWEEKTEGKAKKRA